MKNKYDGVISQWWILWLALSSNRWLRLLPNLSVQEWGPNLNDTGSSNEILSKKYLGNQLSGTRQPGRLIRLPSTLMQPWATWSELIADLVWAGGQTGDTPKVPFNLNPMILALVFRTHSIPAFQPHSPITRTVEVLKKTPVKPDLQLPHPNIIPGASHKPFQLLGCHLPNLPSRECC